MTGGREGTGSAGSGTGIFGRGGGAGERDGGSGVGLFGFGAESEDCDGDLGVLGRLPNSRGIATIQGGGYREGGERRRGSGNACTALETASAYSQIARQVARPVSEEFPEEEHPNCEGGRLVTERVHQGIMG